VDPLALLDAWLENSSLRRSSRDEYRREVCSWLTWCAAQRHPTVHPYHVGPEHVARWAHETFLQEHLGDRPFDGPDALAVLSAENPGLVKSHDRRITVLVQYYKAAKEQRLVLEEPHLHDLRSGLDRDTGAPGRLTPRERAVFIGAVGAWGPANSTAPERDRLLAYLLLGGLRPAQAVRLDMRLMEPQPDLGYHVRLPDDVDGPGRHITLDPMVGDAVRDYLPHRPEPHPGVNTLLLSRLRRPLRSRFPNELVRAIADTRPRLADRYPPVTADTIAHTGLWDESRA
jgi:integrase